MQTIWIVVLELQIQKTTEYDAIVKKWKLSGVWWLI